jgi:3-phosphoshikimate 1-carboxyvinyltransferase
MRERPIEDLLDALRQLGVTADSEQGNGCPPVVVEADGLNGGLVRIRGHVSSQFLSGLLLAAPYARDRVTIEVGGTLVSESYVTMTLKMMEHFGFLVLESRAPVCFEVISHRSRSRDRDYQKQVDAAAFHEGFDPRRHTLLRDYQVEPDASAAGYFWAAAAITGGEVTVPGLTRRSLQGDVHFLEVLEDMGCQVIEQKGNLTAKGGSLQGVDVDMNDISDCVMTLAAVACFAEGPTTIRNVAHIRHKETDRLHALATELRRVGAQADELADGLRIIPGPLHGARIETYNDHRIAMSMALIGLRIPGIVIHNPRCVAKTYPEFFTDLERLRG